MPASQFNVKVEQGATYILTITYKNSAGVPVDLTGYSAVMQFRDAETGRMFLSASSDDGAITLNTVGVIAVRINHARTKQIGAVGQGEYDLFLHYPGDTQVDKLLFGDVEIDYAVTK